MVTEASEGILLSYGKYVYRHVPGWGDLPEGWEWRQAVGVGIDSKQRIYVYNTSAHPMMIFDTEGKLLNHWGEGKFKRPHMITVGKDDTLYTTDIQDHTIRRWTPDGELLMTLGTPNEPAPRMSGQPFNQPTHVAIGHDGSIYVSDGYGNARVHVFSPEGKHLRSWGEPGDRPGQFRSPHCVYIDPSEQVYVVDRENNRIQVFTSQGQFIREIRGLNRPDHIWPGEDGDLIVAELGWRVAFAAGSLPPVNPVTPPAGVKIITPLGQWVGGWGMSTETPGDIKAAHSTVTDAKGDLYVGETIGSDRMQKFERVR